MWSAMKLPRLRRWLGAAAMLAAMLLFPASAGSQGTVAPASEPVAARVWYGEDGRPLPFRSDEEVLEFLRTAKIVSRRNLPRGITDPSILILEKNGLRIRAHLNDVNEERKNVRLPSGRFEPVFRDSYKFNLAAYELARMLGLDNVPPAVERYVGGKRGSVSLWIEGAFMERERLDRDLPPPDPLRWHRQVQVMHVFDNLIFNTDRTQENMLIDSNWNLWMIDHTRAFRHWEELIAPEGIRGCDRELWKKLKALERAEVFRRLDPYLRRFEIDAILVRRDRLVAVIQQLIAQHGEDKILFSR